MKSTTILLVIVGAVIAIGAVLHTVLFPELPVPTWLVTSVATIIGYLFGNKREIVSGAFKQETKKA